MPIKISSCIGCVIFCFIISACGNSNPGHGWSDPVNIGSPVNTDGWEDSVSISPDGNTLYFTYGNYDFLTYIISGGTNRIHKGPDRGLNTSDLGDIMVSYRSGNTWSDPVLANDINEAFALDDGAFTQDDLLFYSSGLKSGNIGGSSKSDIYTSQKTGGIWSTPVNIGSPVNTEDTEANPWISVNDDLLLFESDRPGGYGGNDIWMSEKSGSVWQEPVNLGPVINTAFDDGQPFLTRDEKTLYFSRTNAESGIDIYISAREGEGWSEPVLLLSGLAGEPTLASDGKMLYYVHIYTCDDGTYNADIMYISR
jgi:Tol biopolymer transport system component